jgi:hypothetical protein
MARTWHELFDLGEEPLAEDGEATAEGEGGRGFFRRLSATPLR